MLQTQIDELMVSFFNQYLSLRGDNPEEQDSMRMLLEALRKELPEVISDANLIDEVQRRGLVVPECNARGGA